jgi:hypothetical protein
MFLFSETKQDHAGSVRLKAFQTAKELFSVLEAFSFLLEKRMAAWKANTQNKKASRLFLKSR